MDRKTICLLQFCDFYILFFFFQNFIHLYLHEKLGCVDRPLTGVLYRRMRTGKNVRYKNRFYCQKCKQELLGLCKIITND